MYHKVLGREALSERSLFLELSLGQISETKHQAQTVGNLNGEHSQTSLLIDQRCRPK
jgi:hypothetical protein